MLSASLRRWIRCGTSSFSERDWVGPFYPPGTPPADFLRIYAEHFDTVEVDATYYAIPSEKTVSSWAEKTPEGFTFAAKFPSAIVHAGDGARPDADALLTPDRTYPARDRFLRVMSLLRNRLGPLVLQFPYFRRDVFPDAAPFLDRLDRFLTDLPAEFSCAVEIRNRSWLTTEFAALLARHNAALILQDYPGMPAADELEPLFDPVTADFCYIRLVGDRSKIETVTTTWNREVLDRDESLRRWAGFLQRTVKKRKPIFLFVNNHYAGYAPGTVMRLMNLLNGNE
jgi:uncharacterized protein YecE (DUF72 family)